MLLRQFQELQAVLLLSTQFFLHILQHKVTRGKSPRHLS
jgi:hypothetical protein